MLKHDKKSDLSIIHFDPIAVNNIILEKFNNKFAIIFSEAKSAVASFTVIQFHCSVFSNVKPKRLDLKPIFPSMFLAKMSYHYTAKKLFRPEILKSNHRLKILIDTRTTCRHCCFGGKFRCECVHSVSLPFFFGGGLFVL